MWPIKALLGAVAVLLVGSTLFIWLAPSLPPPSPAKVATTSDDSVMQAGEREYLWQIEHYTLLLSKFWFQQFGEQLASGDGASLSASLGDPFRGDVIEQPIEERLDNKFLQVVRQKSSGRKQRPLTAAEFKDYLLGWRQKFTTTPQVRVVPKLLAPKNPSDLEGSWQGRGVIRLWGQMGTDHPGEVVLHFHFEVPRPDRTLGQRWLRQVSLVQAQWMKSDRHLLRDVTRDRNVDPTELHDNWKSEQKMVTPGGVYLCDFNRDGIVDMLITDAWSYRLYQGIAGGKFEDVTTAMGLPSVPPPPPLGLTIAGFIDIDGDGWEDLVLGNRVLRNEHGQGFMDYTRKSNLRIPQNATGFVVADYDRDGRVDVYFTIPGKGKEDKWVDAQSGLKEGNQLWRNLGNWKFENVTASSNAAAGRRSVFSAVWLDADNDGWPDIYAPNEFGNGVLLLNNRDGTFREDMIMKGPQDFGSMGIACGDVNNDGTIDLYLANMYSKTGMRIIGNVKEGTYPEAIMGQLRRFVAGSQLYLNHGQLKFQPVAEEWQMNDVGWAYGPALVDLDNDGFLDVFATSGYMSVDKSKPDG